MSKYGSDVALLSKLETFDPAAFVDDDNTSQRVCDLVMALALAHNDFRDVIFAQTMLNTVMPGDLQTPTPELGLFAGLQLHLHRTLAGTMHELMKLIQDNRDLLDAPALAAAIRHVPRAARSAWQQVVAAALEKPTKGTISRFLARARNKVAYHYDAPQVGLAFRRAFIRTGVSGQEPRFTRKVTRQPFISRGRSMAACRFYFADAAAAVSLQSSGSDETVEQFFAASMPLLNQINHALREVVTSFITARAKVRRAPAT